MKNIQTQNKATKETIAPKATIMSDSKENSIFETVVSNSIWKYNRLIESNSAMNTESIFLQTNLLLLSQGREIEYSKIEKTYNLLIDKVIQALLEWKTIVISKNFIIDLATYHNNIFPAIVTKPELLINSILINWSDLLSGESWEVTEIIRAILIIVQNSIYRGFPIAITSGAIIVKTGNNSEGLANINIYLSKDATTSFNKKTNIKKLSEDKKQEGIKKIRKINREKIMYILREQKDNEIHVEEQINEIENTHLLSKKEIKEREKQLKKLEKENKRTELDKKADDAINKNSDGSYLDIESLSILQLKFFASEAGIEIEEFETKTSLLNKLKDVTITQDDLKRIESQKNHQDIDNDY